MESKIQELRDLQILNNREVTRQHHEEIAVLKRSFQRAPINYGGSADRRNR